MKDDVIKNIIVELNEVKQTVDVDMLFDALTKLTADKYLYLFKLMNNHINKSFRMEEDELLFNKDFQCMPIDYSDRK